MRMSTEMAINVGDWESLKAAVDTGAQRFGNALGIAATPIEPLELRRFAKPTGVMGVVFEPILSIILQGKKFVTAGSAEHAVEAGQCLIARVDLPTVVKVFDASADRPYLAMSVKLDLKVLRALVDELPPAPLQPGINPDAALLVDELGQPVVQCCRRLVDLLEYPDAAPYLTEGIVREIHYWLLAGRHGGALRSLAAVEGNFDRIQRAIALLRKDFSRSIAIDEVANHVGMSRSTLHQHFKAFTAMSPLQFQKQLRLLAARRMMLTEGAKPTQAAFDVGYESISQFTREYARMFGEPPRRDVVEHSRQHGAGIKAAI